jgi:hypothetical protein
VVAVPEAGEKAVQGNEDILPQLIVGTVVYWGEMPVERRELPGIKLPVTESQMQAFKLPGFEKESPSNHKEVATV